MINKRISKLNPRKHYLQIALNSTLEQAEQIIKQLPISDRILLEAGTPLIKRYGEYGIRKIKQLYEQHLFSPFNSSNTDSLFPYVVADLKMMDRGATEVDIAKRSGASAAVALGMAPIESLNAFVIRCEEEKIDSMIDMMNVEFPTSILRKMKKPPQVVILHRGVDESRENKLKQIPLFEIRRIKGQFDVMISVAGGDTGREVQSAVFNDADIVVVWKNFYESTATTAELAENFLKEIK